MSLHRLLPCLVAVALAAGSVSAQTKQIGKRTILTLSPDFTTLHGARAAVQLLLTASLPGGEQDLTRQAEWSSSNPKVATVSQDGYVRAVGNGTVTIHADHVFRRVSRTLTVVGADTTQAVSFRDEIIPVLNRAGCNQGACHGTPNGKGGFKLSLRGYDVPFDYDVLTREALGRRTNVLDPDASLVLQKPLLRVPHQGGRRLTAGTQDHGLLRQWIAEGLRDDAADRAVMQRLEVVPAKRTVRLQKGGDNAQQLAVLAHFSDGSVRDVTRLAAYSTSNDDIATVTDTGLVKPAARGAVAVLCRYQHSIVSARVTFLQDVPNFVWPNPPETNYIDRHVFAKLKQMQIAPSDLAPDAEFLRRAYLDALGVLPTPDEVRAFLKDADPQKRAKLIDALLERPEFADFWTLKWADVLRLNERYMDPEALDGFHAWLRKQVATDRPLDEFVKELLVSVGNAREVASANFYRPMASAEEAAESVSQLFLGVRIGCAKCHNHPFEKWTQEDYYGMSAVFAQVNLKLVERKPRPFTLKLNLAAKVEHPRTGAVMAPSAPGSGELKPGADGDRRKPFAAWLTRSDNPFFARTMANRIWFHVMGRGIVMPIDDARDSNPPVNDELLEALTQDLIKHGFRLKPLVRTIMNSRTYQLSARANAFNKEDALYFSRAEVRMLTAEQLLDALSSFTGVPEQFEGRPAGTRATQLLGLRSDNAFLKTFNRPNRILACDCERENSANLSQALQMISSRMVQDKLSSDKGRVAALVKSGKADAEVIEELYLAALSRLPSARERQALLAEAARAADRREFFEDLGWSLVNSKEFQFRH
jgi:hypothetical protein